MSGKFNDIIRERINSLEEFPAGVELDAASLWQRTEQQLPKKKHRSFMWWLAPVFAAAVIVYCFFSMSWFTQPQGETVKAILSKSTSVTTVITQQVASSETQQTITAATLQPSSISTAASKNNQPTAMRGVQPVVITTIPVVELNNIPDSITATTPLVIVVAEKKPSAKKLRIIHLNDLNIRPAEPLTQTEVIKANMQREAVPIPNATPAWWSFKSRQQQTP